MEKESFEDREVADLLNEIFICIKVDREERPDIDSVYMSVCQSLTGSGGWPLTILMTPEQKPFWAGTYLPKHKMYGTISIIELTNQIKEMWEEKEDELRASGDKITEFSKTRGESYFPSKEPKQELLISGIKQFYSSYDRANGGFSSAPKFPSPHNLLFLLRCYQETKEKNLLNMVEKTLDQMYRGGMFDHIGGGFSRYSTDEHWLIPHFEKMLYDNALLAIAYTQAFQLTNKPIYEYTAKCTLDYVIKELLDDQNGFHCGQDADSEGVEGKYYVFTPDEIIHVLGKESGTAFCKQYQITESGNFEGKSIPNLLSFNEFLKIPDEDLKKTFRSLHQYRLNRTKLHKDDKILTSWNALMIMAFCKGYMQYGKKEYLETGMNAAEFIMKELMDEEHNLYLRWRENESSNIGQLDDYAFFGNALIELYECTFHSTFLKCANLMGEKIIQYFWDEAEGGCYLYSANQEQLISRPKELYDGAIPSGNSMTAILFHRLFTMTGQLIWKERAEKQHSFLAGNIADYPSAFSMSLYGIANALYQNLHLICVTKDQIDTNELLVFRKKSFQPISIVVITENNRQELLETAPYLNEYKIPDSGTLYYLCKNGACMTPVSQLSELEIESVSFEI